MIRRSTILGFSLHPFFGLFCLLFPTFFLLKVIPHSGTGTGTEIIWADILEPLVNRYIIDELPGGCVELIAPESTGDWFLDAANLTSIQFEYMRVAEAVIDIKYILMSEMDITIPLKFSNWLDLALPRLSNYISNSTMDLVEPLFRDAAHQCSQIQTIFNNNPSLASEYENNPEAILKIHEALDNIFHRFAVIYNRAACLDGDMHDFKDNLVGNAPDNVQEALRRVQPFILA